MDKKPKTTRALGPNMPAPYELADIGAIKALLRGEASGPQQQRALKWIIECAAGTYEHNYYAGEDGDRNTAFALGRAFVGQQIVKLTKISSNA